MARGALTQHKPFLVRTDRFRTIPTHTHAHTHTRAHIHTCIFTHTHTHRRHGLASQRAFLIAGGWYSRGTRAFACGTQEWDLPLSKLLQRGADPIFDHVSMAMHDASPLPRSRADGTQLHPGRSSSKCIHDIRLHTTDGDMQPDHWHIFQHHIASMSPSLR